MATIERIQAIEAHPNPEVNALEFAIILGFRCLVKKNQMNEGDLVVFIRPDHVLPNDRPWAIPLLKFAPNRIRAIKLKGAYSEGIILKLEEVKDDLKDVLDVANVASSDVDSSTTTSANNLIGRNVSQELGIRKYESQPVNHLLMRSNKLPYDLPKTDEERWQNIVKELPLDQETPEKCDVTLKIDGQSCSFGYKDGDFFVTSRNMDLKLEEKNAYTNILNFYPIQEKLTKYCQEHKVNLCLRGESYGPGIQNFKHNPHSQLKQRGWAMFSVYDLDQGRYYLRGSKHYFLNVAKALDLPHVSVLEQDVDLTRELIHRYCDKLEKIEIKAGLQPQMFEGAVVQYSTGSFKIINKYYDSKK